MKKNLTIEQSANLIAKGISQNKASEISEYADAVSQWTRKGYSIFTLDDLMKILPREIKRDKYSTYQFNLIADEVGWEASYVYYRGDLNDESIGISIDTELIDCIYNLIVWLLDNKYIEAEYNPPKKEYKLCKHYVDMLGYCELKECWSLLHCLCPYGGKDIAGECSNYE